MATTIYLVLAFAYFALCMWKGIEHIKENHNDETREYILMGIVCFALCLVWPISLVGSLYLSWKEDKDG